LGENDGKSLELQPLLHGDHLVQGPLDLGLVCHPVGSLEMLPALCA
jgi:hypothetical protein